MFKEIIARRNTKIAKLQKRIKELEAELLDVKLRKFDELFMNKQEKEQMERRIQVYENIIREDVFGNGRRSKGTGKNDGIKKQLRASKNAVQKND